MGKASSWLLATILLTAVIVATAAVVVASLLAHML
jgi:hypothetical protein